MALISALSLSARPLTIAIFHSFEADAHLLRLGLDFNRVNASAQTGNNHLVLHSDKPLQFGNLRVKWIDLLLKRWPNHFGFPQV